MSYITSFGPPSPKMYRVHSSSPCAPAWLKNPCLKLISIDPGLTHLCVSLQLRCHLLPDAQGHHPDCRRKTVVLSVIKTNLKSRRDLKRKTPSNDMGLVAIDDSIGTLEGKELQPFNTPDQGIANMCVLLKGLDITGVDVIFCEQQLKRNHDMVRLAPAIMAHLLTRFNGPVIELDARLKSLTLAPGRKVVNVKKWSESYAVNLFIQYGDTEAHTMVTQRGKINDLCDVVVQVEAFFVHINLITLKEYSLPDSLFFNGQRARSSVLKDVQKRARKV